MWRTATFSCLFLLLSSAVFHTTYGSDELKFLQKRDASKQEWSYEDPHGPNKWGSMFHSCNGKRQSPIDIELDKVDLDDDLEEIDFNGYDTPLDDAIILNNGHTVVIKPNKNDAERSIEEGSLDDKFIFRQLHFHWGSDNKRGSEHTINKERYPLEMHLVHQNAKYEKWEDALKKEDGIAVLAVLFKHDDEDNEDLEPIIDKLDDVRKEGDSATVDIELENLLPDDTMPYYRYDGSLTTPPCSEAVLWTVFKHFQTISVKQLQQFRNVKEDEDPGEAEEPLVDNFRPIQPINMRVVSVSGEEKDSGMSVTSSPALMVFLITALLLYVKKW